MTTQPTQQQMDQFINNVRDGIQAMSPQEIIDKGLEEVQSLIAIGTAHASISGALNQGYETFEAYLLETNTPKAFARQVIDLVEEKGGGTHEERMALIENFMD